MARSRRILSWSASSSERSERNPYLDRYRWSVLPIYLTLSILLYFLWNVFVDVVTALVHQHHLELPLHQTNR